MDLLHTLFYFVIVIGVLVSFHEFGHYWVARKVGVKVIRFSVGFGKVLWKYQANPQTTEYVISAIPLGGYVKMVDEREGDVSSADLPYAFNRQSVWARSAIVAAGPIFNLILATLLLWSVFVIGELGVKPVIGEVLPNTIAFKAGFVEGDEILSVDDKVTPIWSEALNDIVSEAINGNKEIKVTVMQSDGVSMGKSLILNDEDVISPETLYLSLGLKPWSPKLKPIIGHVLPDSAALAAGLKDGDLIVSADGELVPDWMHWVSLVKTRPEIAINLLVDRAGVQIPITITPKKVAIEQSFEGKIGASVFVPDDIQKNMQVEYKLSPLDALPVAIKATAYYSVSTLKMLSKMFVGKASVENLSGPISIAQYAGQSANMGISAFLRFMALVSVSLGVLNLLPVPVLDGGHLMFFALEGLIGRPVPQKIQMVFQQIGMSLLLLLMSVAMFMDVQRLFH